MENANVSWAWLTGKNTPWQKLTLVTDSLPDRLVNPEEYEPLIPAVNQQRTENYQNEPFTAQARVTPTNTYGITD